MVTLKGYTANLDGKSTDSKPTDVEVNTIFHELDTDKKYYFDGTTWNEMPASGGGGSSFTPTEAQLTAMNSGITSEDVQQISTNESNISSCKQFTDNATIDSNRKLYISATEPTGDIPQGSTWIDGKTIKSYTQSTNQYDTSNTTQGYIDGGGRFNPSNDFLTTDYINAVGGKEYRFATQSDMTGHQAFRVCEYTGDDTFTTRTLSAMGEQTFNIILRNNTTKIRISYPVDATGLTAYYDDWF